MSTKSQLSAMPGSSPRARAYRLRVASKYCNTKTNILYSVSLLLHPALRILIMALKEETQINFPSYARDIRSTYTSSG